MRRETKELNARSEARLPSVETRLLKVRTRNHLSNTCRPRQVFIRLCIYKALSSLLSINHLTSFCRRIPGCACVFSVRAGLLPY